MFTADHLQQHAAQGVNVRLQGVLAVEELGCHVRSGARLVHRHEVWVFQVVRDAEVDELGLLGPLHEHHVGGLDVAVDDARVQVLQGLGDLQPQLQDAPVAELCGLFVDEVVQRGAADVLEHHCVVGLGEAGPVQPDDLARAEPRQDARLDLKRAQLHLLLLLWHVCEEHLHRHRRAVARGAEHLPEGALADDLRTRRTDQGLDLLPLHVHVRLHLVRRGHRDVVVLAAASRRRCRERRRLRLDQLHLLHVHQLQGGRHRRRFRLRRLRGPRLHAARQVRQQLLHRQARLCAPHRRLVCRRQRRRSRCHRLRALAAGARHLSCHALRAALQRRLRCLH
mmetsp:Transcript_7084/g.18161  ORF Transcript_7084/g.18161 Transcript_7084/m.18161 type:complete len:338 (-) Transcript_7084:1234-2247(-)